jgi:uncharacterized membrane protein
VSWLGLVAIVIGLVALRRIGELRARLTSLERRIAELRAPLRESSSRSAATTASESLDPTSLPVTGKTPDSLSAPASREVDRAGQAIAAPIGAGAQDAIGSADRGAPRSAAGRPVPTRGAPPARGASPPPRPRRPIFEISWEQWIGVRGAAVLGGVVLALAGLYFFQYSIEHGLIPPWLRVVCGTALGMACIVGAEWKARERYAATANALIGGGVVILYAAIWAARGLYELIDLELAFGGMIAVTAACTALSYRHASLVIALIGLLGGFATPLLLSTGTPRPIGLFAYILLLDSCLLFIANRRGWPLLALLSLVGTLFYQAVWISAQMGADELLLALAILGAFAVLFAIATRTIPQQARREWLITQAGGLLFPFAFAVYFAFVAKFGRHFYPIGMLLVVLSAAASWLGVMQQRSWLGLGAASGSVAIFAVWALSRSLDAPLAWEAAACAALLAALFHAFVEWRREPAGAGGPAHAAITASLGMFAVLIAAGALQRVALWPWLFGWLALSALLVRHAGFSSRGALQLAAAVALGVGLWSYYDAHARGDVFPDHRIYAVQLALIAIAAQIVAMLRRAPSARRWADRAAASFPLLIALSLADGPAFRSDPILFLGLTLLLGFLALLAATRLGSGRWVFASMAITALVHTGWTDARSGATEGVLLAGYAVQLLAVGVFTFWPFLALERLRNERWSWYSAALAGPAWFYSLRQLHRACFDDVAIGLLPILLGALALTAAWRVTRAWGPSDPMRKSNLAWLLAVAIGFATAAIPLQLEKEWITIGWALEAAGVALLWRRLDHPGLKYFALALIVGTSARLVANHALLGYYARPQWRIVNWLLYTYWVCAGALIAASRVFRRDEVSRVREWESRAYRWRQPLVSSISGIGAIAILFVWINLAIADWFATGTALDVSFQRMPARDLTTSIAWALYGLALLALGVRARSAGLRWLSLGLVMLTVVKVFLYDLGELEDLYRVASLLGLAVSLILVSLAYQRFVVRAAPKEGER